MLKLEKILPSIDHVEDPKYEIVYYNGTWNQNLQYGKLNEDIRFQILDSNETLAVLTIPIRGFITR
jgi:hypothetical protein